MYSQKSALVTLLSKAWGHHLTITAKAADWKRSNQPLVIETAKWRRSTPYCDLFARLHEMLNSEFSAVNGPR